MSLGLALSSVASAETAVPAPAPLPTEITIAANFPFDSVALLGSLPHTTIVLDLSRGPLTRGRVDLVEKLAATFGARLRGAPSAAEAKLLRRLQPAVLVIDGAEGEDPATLAAALDGLEARTFRFELPRPPTAAQLAAWKRLRPLTVRFPLGAAGDDASKAVLRMLASWPGRAEAVVGEDAKPELLRALPWPERAALVVLPRGGSYLADATIDAFSAASRSRHVVRVALPLGRVDAAQLRRLPGTSLELSVEKPPEREELRALRRTITGASWPAERPAESK